MLTMNSRVPTISQHRLTCATSSILLPRVVIRGLPIGPGHFLTDPKSAPGRKSDDRHVLPGPPNDHKHRAGVAAPVVHKPGHVATKGSIDVESQGHLPRWQVLSHNLHILHIKANGDFREPYPVGSWRTC